MSRRAVDVPGIAAPQAHYSHAILSGAGGLLWVAGQVAIAPDGTVAPDATTQAQQVMDNLEAVLAAAGAHLDDVVKTTTFLVNLDDRAAVGEVRRQRFADPAPANTLLVVTSLAEPTFLVEIEAVAAVPAPT